MTIHLRQLKEGSRFVLLRTGEKFRYLGLKPSRYTGQLLHMCQSEADKRETALHNACHVKPIIRFDLK